MFTLCHYYSLNQNVSPLSIPYTDSNFFIIFITPAPNTVSDTGKGLLKCLLNEYMKSERWEKNSHFGILHNIHLCELHQAILSKNKTSLWHRTPLCKTVIHTEVWSSFLGYFLLTTSLDGPFLINWTFPWSGMEWRSGRDNLETEVPPGNRRLDVLAQWLVLLQHGDIKYHWRGHGGGTRKGVQRWREFVKGFLSVRTFGTPMADSPELHPNLPPISR